MASTAKQEPFDEDAHDAQGKKKKKLVREDLRPSLEYHAHVLDVIRRTRLYNSDYIAQLNVMRLSGALTFQKRRQAFINDLKVALTVRGDYASPRDVPQSVIDELLAERAKKPQFNVVRQRQKHIDAYTESLAHFQSLVSRKENHVDVTLGIASIVST